MKKLFLLFNFYVLFAQNITTGLDASSSELIKELQGKNIAIVANQTSILQNKEHLVDFLASKNIKIQTIFAPEHGFRGDADAGETIKDGKDLKTNIPIISLYGKNKKPSLEMLRDLDFVLFDIQDVGVRFYTYISTLHYVMEACAEAKIPMIIIDRPNPNISIVDGPVLEKEHTSFVGMHPIPVLHGMTIAEYAQMINGENWLANAVKCELIIKKCNNYSRKKSYSLPVKPSPNLPNDLSINLYASLCFFEGTNVSVGRGTEKQFQIYGSPFLPKKGFSFTPKPNFGAKDPLHNGKKCWGEDLTKNNNINLLDLKWLIKAYKNTSNKKDFFNSFFTKLAGTITLQSQIKKGISEKEIRKSWQKDLDAFKKTREKYLIYK
jgi:uncharacterized protein YbbC (DUF1343 family)